MNAYERAELSRQVASMTWAQQTATDIARRLRVDPRTVYRYRSRLRAAGILQSATCPNCPPGYTCTGS